MIVKNLQTTCTHCGLPVPAGLIEAGQEEQFCCHGCATAYRLIHANGLDSFYRMLDASTDRNALRRDVEKREQFDEFDEPVFRDKYVVRNGVSQCQTSLSIDGIHCAACIWLIEKLPRILPGVIDAQVNWAKGTVRVQWDDEQARLSQIATTLDRLGYTPEPIVQSRAEQKRLRENRAHLVRIGIAAAAAGNNMLIAASLYLGMYSFMSPGTMQLLRVASCLVGLAALIWPGRVFLSGAWNAIRTRTPHMDLPIALALFVGTAAGLVNTVRGTGEIYFDSLSVLIFLLLLGRWIQFRQQNRAADAVELLHRLIPARARKLMGDQIVETYVDLIQPGDLLEIRPHDLLPVDAVVVNGESKLDESILTGESRPVSKNIGDNVLAGTRNCDSRLVVRATATGGETRLSGIVRPGRAGFPGQTTDCAMGESGRRLLRRCGCHPGGVYILLVVFGGCFGRRRTDRGTVDCGVSLRARDCHATGAFGRHWPGRKKQDHRQIG